MTDQEYKRAFALLTEKLGRAPTPKDREWVTLTEQLRRSYLPAEEEPRRRPVQEGGTPAGGSPVLDTREGASEALSGPGITQSGVDGLDNLPGASPPSRIDEGALVGARGPSGGIYAKCDGCGRVWERERRRGRPARMCGGCK